MKKTTLLLLAATAAWSMDFSQMSTDELIKLRGTLSPADRPAFRAEMQKRMQSMTPQERQQLMGQGRGMGGQGMGQGRGMGRGMGGQGMGQGRGGKGMMNRPTFADYDLNKDGKLTSKEFYDAQAKRMQAKAAEGRMMKNAGNAPTFESIDTDKNGVVTPEEFRAHQMKRMQQRRGGGMGGQGMGQGRGMSM